MADEFKFPIEDGKTVYTKYDPAIHRLSNKDAVEFIIDTLKTYGKAGSDISYSASSEINGEYKIEITDSDGNVQTVYAGISATQSGGKTRPDDEHRIQMPATLYNDLYIKRQQGEKTVLLGVYYWNSDEMMPQLNNGYKGQHIICAWEPTASESTSPASKQIKASTIAKAISVGFAQKKGGIISCAFRPELIYFFLDNSDWITKSNLTDFPVDQQFTEEMIDGIEENNNSVDDENADSPENLLFYGVPGAGKSYYIDTHYTTEGSEVERIVFHPDYTYSDFVGQILPKVVSEEKNGSSNSRIIYKFSPGPFTRILKKAVNEKDSTKRFYLVIEELNRGNAPAIFGEIFQLLDRKENGESRYGIKNTDIAEYVYGDIDHNIIIPKNLWILATMNTSDQNVFTLDTAFQRRWNMIHIPNSFEGNHFFDSMIEKTAITWRAFAEVINDQLLNALSEMSSSEDKRLGAFFVSKRELAADRFPQKVLKYLWDDAFRIDREYLFNSTIRSLDDIIEAFSNGHGDPLATIIKDDLYTKMSIKSKIQQGE